MFFLKKRKYFTGLNIEENGQYQLIELEKINNSYVPVFYFNGKCSLLLNNNIFVKKEFIKEFKKRIKNLKNNNIFLNSFKNKKLENEIVSSLKIVGFNKIKINNFYNIEGIILNNNKLKEMTVLLTSSSAIFYIVENNYLIKREILPLENLSVGKIISITKTLTEKHIYLISLNPKLSKPLKKLFQSTGIKVHIQNIWKNFLNFNDGIPSIFLDQSHTYLNVLSITVPNLKKWNEVQVKEKVIVKKEKVIEKKLKKVLFLPKPKKIIRLFKNKTIFLPKAKKTNLEKKSVIISTVNTVPKNKIMIFLKQPLFLPKLQKKINLPKKKKTSNFNQNKEKKTFWKKISKILNSKI